MPRIKIRPRTGSKVSTSSRLPVSVSDSIQTDVSSYKIFAKHLQRYIGETITIFTIGGGLSGLGFTGVVLDVNGSYIRLMAKPGPAPSCPRTLDCNSDFYEHKPRNILYQAPVPLVGAEVFIPISKIASVIHSTV
jgi:hypothetical protein